MKRFFFLTVVAPLLLLASVVMADEKLAITSTDAGIQTAGDADNLELARVFDDANAGDAQTTGLDAQGNDELDAEATCFRSWGGCYGYNRCYSSYSYCYPSYSYCYPSYSYCYPTYSYCYPTCYSYSSYCFPSYCGWGY